MEAAADHHVCSQVSCQEAFCSAYCRMNLTMFWMLDSLVVLITLDMWTQTILSPVLIDGFGPLVAHRMQEKKDLVANAVTSEHSPPQDEPIYCNVDAAVEAGSDVVCNMGIECAVVADDSSTDEEKGRIACFLSEGCKCQLNHGRPCSALFTASQVMVARDECQRLTQDQLDVMIMGQLRALCQLDSLTQVQDQEHGPYTYSHSLLLHQRNGQWSLGKVCQPMCMYVRGC